MIEDNSFEKSPIELSRQTGIFDESESSKMNNSSSTDDFTLENGAIHRLCRIGGYQLILGPGYQFITPSILLIGFSIFWYLFNYFLIQNCLDNAIYKNAVNLLFALFAILIGFNAFVAPGYWTPKSTVNDEEFGTDLEHYYCRLCLVTKEDQEQHKIRHCDDCQICILNYDHHCIVLGNCIGKNNIYTFWGMFVLSILVSMCSYGLAFYAATTCGSLIIPSAFNLTGLNGLAENVVRMTNRNNTL